MCATALHSCSVEQGRNQKCFRAGEVTQNFIFSELGHFDKHSTIARETNAPQGKNIRFFAWKLLKTAF